MSEKYTHLPNLMQASQGCPSYDEAREDSVDKMWSGYMREANNYDERVSDAWKDDANGVLVFTGLFSATVATFLVASYPMLSSNSGDETAYLLGQITQQLAAFSSNGTFTIPTPYQSSPSRAIILVNSLWLLSLLLSLSSALAATLVQQWARRYIQLPQIPSLPKERARVRSYLFLGIQTYHMSRAVEAAPALLHISVFFFFAGLVIFFFTIYKAVAIVVSICVGFIGFVYIILTILPCLDHRCPYRTPMSSFWWYCWHTSLGFNALCARWFLKQLHWLLVPSNAGEVTTSVQRILSNWWERLDGSFNKHRNRLKAGFRGTIVRRAIEASTDVDSNALTWLLNEPALSDKSKIQEFVDSIPGDTVVQLIRAPIHSGTMFSQHLQTLLRSCTPGSIGLDDEMRRGRLNVCLNAIHHIAKAYSNAPHDEIILDNVRVKFANIGLMRSLWTDSDPAIRVTSRSICALLAKPILHRYSLRESELAWLQEVLGESSNVIYNSLHDPRTVNIMNIDSFVYGVLSATTGDLPPAQATSFVDTLAILMNAGGRPAIRKSLFEGGFSELLQRAENDDHLPVHEVADKLRRIFEAMFPSLTPKPPKSC